jgi:predicted subunit of tRNA(5-methylaminomethyl-2-thiouridylate) methyltransferase
VQCNKCSVTWKNYDGLCLCRYEIPLLLCGGKDNSLEIIIVLGFSLQINLAEWNYGEMAISARAMSQLASTKNREIFFHDKIMHQ